MDEVKVIDAHVHIWDWSSLSHRAWLEGREELERSFMPTDLHDCFQSCGVDQGILIEAEKSTYSLSIWWLEVTEYCPYLKQNILGCDLERDNLSLWLESFGLWPGFKGMRAELLVAPEGWMQNPALLRALRTLQEQRFHLEVETTAEGICGIAALAEHHPDLKFIINHSANPPQAGEDFSQWMRDIESLAQRGNVYIKTSDCSLPDDADTCKTTVGFLVDVLGAHRILWGSGWPVLRSGLSYAAAFDAMKLAVADLPKAAQDSIFGGNAAQLYRV
jgi:L-fuconolactonase